ncbi:hypothetical protein SB48_HM08orf04955 [Heyndrickxia coagulans]|uniref:Uncharacterized protein n=1 Tax=Heyndrickxia coagulans TaxID=1398 RepID=A0AAN0T8Q7_HEYCO|nr:hypothetical protein SB48_HM08orf04955 [Heyndrickxia coagulans]
MGFFQKNRMELHLCGTMKTGGLRFPGRGLSIRSGTNDE